MIASFPPTIIVRSPRENPQKCSVLPLRGRADLLFFEHPVKIDLDLAGYVRLAPEGPLLTEADAGCGLLILDGSWRRARQMNDRFLSVPERSLGGYRTAYPRVSKKGTDPASGLASVEALYIAYRILGRPTAGLLDHYRWADEFRRLNGFDAES
jgi:pre-rRNA-processing protein TSR3